MFFLYLFPPHYIFNVCNIVFWTKLWKNEWREGSIKRFISIHNIKEKRWSNFARIDYRSRIVNAFRWKWHLIYIFRHFSYGCVFQCVSSVWWWCRMLFALGHCIFTVLFKQVRLKFDARDVSHLWICSHFIITVYNLNWEFAFNRIYFLTQRAVECKCQ